MSDTSQHHTSPSASIDPAAIDAAPTDLIAGDPPVPITVWRTARTEADTWYLVKTLLGHADVTTTMDVYLSRSGSWTCRC